MVCGTQIFVAVIAMIAIVAISVEANSEKELKCAGEKVTMPDEYMTAAKECYNETKSAGDSSNNDDTSSSTPEEKKEKAMAKMRCFQACQYRKVGLLVDDSKPEFNYDKLDTLGGGFPESVRDGLKSDLKACLEAVTEPLTDDDNCKSHETYQQCMMKAYITNCKWEDKKSE